MKKTKNKINKKILNPAKDLEKKWFKILDWKNNRPVNNAKNAKIELASQSKIDEFQDYVDKVLKAFGHSEALVTDESYVTDLLDVFLSREERIKKLENVSKKLKVSVLHDDYVWMVAQKMAGVDIAKKLKHKGE